jgi:hypothetical protein
VEIGDHLNQNANLPIIPLMPFENYMILAVALLIYLFYLEKEID